MKINHIENKKLPINMIKEHSLCAVEIGHLRRLAFVSKKMPNNAVMTQILIVLIVLVVNDRTMSTIEMCGITVLFGILLGDKQSSKSHKT